MASALLKVKRVTASSHSAHYKPECVLEDAPHDVSSRWTGEYHRSSPSLRGEPEWLKLELENPAVVKTITFGKVDIYMAAHPCDVDQFKIYGSCEDNDDMTLLLHSSLKNDEIPQTFALKHLTTDGVVFPCRFIKIVPITPFNQTYNMSIWYVALRGIDAPELVQKVLQDYIQFRESVAMRLILKHLRLRNSVVYPALLEETGLQIENPMISRLYDTFVAQGDHLKAEEILVSCASANLIDFSLQNPQTRPTTTWKRVWSTNEDGNIPTPRGGHACAFDSAHGTLYIFGGWDGTQDLGDFWAYSVPAARWTRLSASAAAEGGPGPRSCGSAIFDPETGDIFFLGRYVVKMSPAEKRKQAAQMQQQQQQANGAEERERRTARDLLVTRAMHSVENGDTASMSPPTTVLASGEDIQMTSSKLPKSDFYRYSTRGPNEGKWELLSTDTKGDGGIELAHDLALAIDSESQVIYVFGGEVYSYRRDAAKHYGSCCAYDIRTKEWRKLFSDSSSSGHRCIPSRDVLNAHATIVIGHSMIFDPASRRLYILGGERSGQSFDNIWTYDVQTGQVAEMTLPEASPRPNALQMLRATADPESREIFAISELASSPLNRTRPEPDAENVFATLWIYSMDENTWSPILEPVRGGGTSSPTRSSNAPSDEKEADNAREPRPRLGHSVVHDPVRQAFYVFGGNGGGGTRLNDFWSLTLNRPTVDDVIRKGKLCIRSQKFREMCEVESSLTALQYLQQDVSTVVNHNDEEESAAFQQLLSFLLSRPMSPTSPCVPQLPLPHPTDARQEIGNDTRNSDVEMTDAAATYVVVGTSELHKQRIAAFDYLLGFIDPRAKQPKADIMDLIRSEL